MEFKELGQAILDASNLAEQKNKELYAARVSLSAAEKALSESLQVAQDSSQDGGFYHVAIALDDIVLDCMWGAENRYELTQVKKL